MKWGLKRHARWGKAKILMKQSRASRFPVPEILKDNIRATSKLRSLLSWDANMDSCSFESDDHLRIKLGIQCPRWRVYDEQLVSFPWRLSTNFAHRHQLEVWFVMEIILVRSSLGVNTPWAKSGGAWNPEILGQFDRLFHHCIVLRDTWTIPLQATYLICVSNIEKGIRIEFVLYIWRTSNHLKSRSRAIEYET